MHIYKHISFILLEPTCLHVKMYDCLLELLKQIAACLTL